MFGVLHIVVAALIYTDARLRVTRQLRERTAAIDTRAHARCNKIPHVRVCGMCAFVCERVDCTETSLMGFAVHSRTHSLESGDMLGCGAFAIESTI